MTRFFGILSVLVLSMAVAAGCKKDEAKTDTAAAPTGDQPATGATDPATAATPPAGGEQPAAAGGGGEFNVDEACTKTIAMLEGMGSAVSSNKGNCDAMGDALQKWADDNKDFIAWGKSQDDDPAKKKEFDEKCGPKMTPVMEKLGPAMAGAQECATNEKVKAAMANLE